MVIRISSWAIFKILWSGNLQNLALYVFDIILISTTFVRRKQIEMVQRLYRLDVEEHEYNRANSSTD